MRLIDADEVLKRWGLKFYAMGGDRLGPNGDEISFYVNGLLNEIQNAPTVELQKIVTIPPELIEKLASCVVDIVGNIDWEKAIEAYKARPQGKWYKTGQSFIKADKFRNYGCSNCFYELDEHIRKEPNFCPNCGADMRGGRE